MYSKNHIEAIKIVQKLTREQMALIDHFYQGDQDTFTEAFDSLMAEFGVELSYWEMDPDERNKFIQEYKQEIEDKLSELVEWGKHEMDSLKKFDDHLTDLLDHVEINLSCNIFDFPEGSIEIDGTDFDPSLN